MTADLNMDDLLKAKRLLESKKVPKPYCFYDPYKDEVVEHTAKNVAEYLDAAQVTLND